MGTGLRTLDLAATSEQQDTRTRVNGLRPGAVWSPENFAREQIRGLVRQVFFSNVARPVRQVVLSAVESETDVCSLCRRVGEALALETAGCVAVEGRQPRAFLHSYHPDAEHAAAGTSTSLRQCGNRVRDNLWLLPAAQIGSDFTTTASLHSHLCELRREFDFSIVEGPPAGESNEATAMAQLADGIILVLSANRTRRAAASKIKDTLERAQARLLGTVLCDRVFPIPEGIYRRL